MELASLSRLSDFIIKNYMLIDIILTNKQKKLGCYNMRSK